MYLPVLQKWIGAAEEKEHKFIGANKIYVLEQTSMGEAEGM